jgi:hypothetical protein
MTGPWTKLVAGVMSMMTIATDREIGLLRQHPAPPYGRSKRTTAQDQRAAAKRRAVKLAKKRGQA